MSDAPLVITDATGEVKPSMDGIFSGLAFFVTQRTPFRARYIEKIQNNGGRVVRIEDQASYIICDHVRRDAPSGGFSYVMIDDALKNGQMPEPEKYAVAQRPVAVRTVGSGSQPRATRTPFTAEDDRVLWNWIRQAEENGEYMKGNTLYQRLAAINPRHTFQSWRDRYIKRLINLPPDSFPSEEAPLASPQSQPISSQPGQPGGSLPAPATLDTPPATQSPIEAVNAPQASSAAKPAKRKRKPVGSNTQSAAQDDTDRRDIEKLLEIAEEVIRIPPKSRDAAWQAWHQAWPTRSVQQWMELFDDHVLPIYEANIEATSAKRRRTNLSDADSVDSDHDPLDEDQEGAGRVKHLDGGQGDAAVQDEIDIYDISHGEVGAGTYGAVPRERNLATQEASIRSPLHDADLPERNDDDDLIAPDISAEDRRGQEALSQDDAAVANSAESLPGWQSSAAEIEFSQYVDEKSPWPSSVGQSPSRGQAAVQKPAGSLAVPSLTKMRHQRHGSQNPEGDLHDDVNYDPDLTLPEPEGGFDINTTPQQSLVQRNGASDKAADSSELRQELEEFATQNQHDDRSLQVFAQDTSPQSRRPTRSAFVLDTQDIYNAESQDLGLAVPPPLESQFELTQPSGRTHAATGADTDAEALDEDMDAWMARMKDDGHATASIIASLKCTSMRPELAEYVLLENKYGRGVPADTPGVWSELDDIDLEGGDARRLRAIEEKHGGWEELQLRRKFLEDFRELS